MSLNKSKAMATVAKRIMPVSDAEPHVNVLVYGRNGHGKTRFAASSPNTLIADVNEKGTQSVRHSGADVFHVKKWEDITYLYWYLRDGDHSYDTVVIDTLTQLQNMCMAHVLKRQEDRDPNRPPSMPDRRSWGQLGELMKPLLLDFRNLPMNTVFVCQMRKDFSAEEEDAAATRYVPDLSPSVRGIAMACVGVMGYIFRKEHNVVRKGEDGKKKTSKAWATFMLVGPHESYETKDRTNQLGSIVRNPTMQLVIDAAQKEEEPNG